MRQALVLDHRIHALAGIAALAAAEHWRANVLMGYLHVLHEIGGALGAVRTQFAHKRTCFHVLVSDVPLQR